jgi:hypothetical protein
VKPANYLEHVKKLQPGDTLLLSQGVYRKGLPLYNLNGNSAKPITIIGPSLENHRAMFIGNDRWNTVRIKNSSYLEIYNLELNGNSSNGDAVSAEGIGVCAHHITLDNLLIYGYDVDQGVVGISTSRCATWAWRIRNNIIKSVGTGMYLGNSPGNNPFIHGLIENNLIMDTIGYNIQIKHQLDRPLLPSKMSRSGKTVIRHNVFSKENRGSTGIRARPNLLVGHWPLEGPGSHDLYEIYGNFFYQNPDEYLFQGEGNIAFYNNLLVNQYGGAINIRYHNDKPRQVSIFHNTVVANDIGISVTGGDDDYVQSVTGNYVFAEEAIIAPVVANNVVDKYTNSIFYLKNPLQPIGDLDLMHKNKLPDSASKVSPLITANNQSNSDFEGALRDQLYSGAYAGFREQVNWPLQLNRKPYNSEASAPRPVVKLYLHEELLDSGNMKQYLIWVSANATRCTASGDWQGIRDTQGKISISQKNKHFIYKLACNGPGGRSVVAIEHVK